MREGGGFQREGGRGDGGHVDVRVQGVREGDESCACAEEECEEGECLSSVHLEGCKVRARSEAIEERSDLTRCSEISHCSAKRTKE